MYDLLSKSVPLKMAVFWLSSFLHLYHRRPIFSLFDRTSLNQDLFHDLTVMVVTAKETRNCSARTEILHLSILSGTAGGIKRFLNKQNAKCGKEQPLFTIPEVVAYENFDCKLIGIHYTLKC